MASRRAAVTSFSLATIACSSTGERGLSVSLAGAGAAPCAAAGSPSSAASEMASPLLVILILVAPMLPFEGPVLLVIAHQAFELELREHVGRVAPVAEVGDLDLELLLLADHGVD